MNTHTKLSLNNLWDLLRLTGFNFGPIQWAQISITGDEYYGDPTEEIASYPADPTAAASPSPDPAPEEFEHDYMWFLA